MIRNYLKVAFRNLVNQKFYSFINIFGLSIGIACCILILLHVKGELGYDRFHPDHHRIYRVAALAEGADGRELQYAPVGFGWGEIIYRDIPGIQDYTRILNPFQANNWVVLDNERYAEEKWFWGDSSLTSVLQLDFVHGDPRTCLTKLESVVLTEAKAKKYFGNQNPLNQKLGLEFGPEVVYFNVTGVIKEIPENSHMHFDFMASSGTLKSQIEAQNPNARLFSVETGLQFTAFHTYMKFKEGTDPEQVEASFPDLVTKYLPQDRPNFMTGLFLQPLTDIHLHSNLLAEIETNGNIVYVYILASIALFILIIACINFMNLATARSANRSKEVGIRKTVGTYRTNLIKQFIIESLMTACLSTSLAIFLAMAGLGLFNQLLDSSLVYQDFADPIFLIAATVITLFVGLLAGSYPAFFLSSFRPIEVIKGKLKSGKSSSLLRNILVTGQFTVSIALIIGISLIFRQLNYIQSKDLGFERDYRIIIPIDTDNQNHEREQQIELLRQASLSNPNILGFTATSATPGQLRPLTPIRLDDAPPDETFQFTTLDVDYEYARTMGVEIIQGRFFQHTTDSLDKFLINEAGLKMLGLDDPINQKMDWLGNQVIFPDSPAVSSEIIGVYKNMNFEPLHRATYPMLFRLNAANFQNMVVKIEPGRIAEALPFLEERWEEIVPNRPFQYTFLDRELNEIYQAEQKLSRIVGFFTVVAIIIACLGLFGLSAFTAEQRTKEIGVRKVLGASIPNLIFLLSKEVSFLILIAFILASPIAYYIMNGWLENFAYKVPVSIDLFLLSGGSALIICWITVSYQSFKAAAADPVKSLRYE